GPGMSSALIISAAGSRATTGSGPALSLESVYREHAAKVARWARWLAEPGVDIEDLVHDVFLVVRRKLGLFRPEAKVTTWLYRITERTVRCRRRKDRKRSQLLDTWRREAAFELPSTPFDHLAALMRQEDLALVTRTLDRMPEPDRTLLTLFEIDGFK